MSMSAADARYGSMNQRGVTLIEMVVVSAIIVILAVAAGFAYQGWMGRYKMEKMSKELYTDLMNTRSLALTRSRMYFVTLIDANNYSVTEDTNDSLVRGDTVGGVTDRVLATYPKNIEYAFSWGGAVPANQTVSFDKRGVMNIGGTICFNSDFNADGTDDVDPDYDCIVISQTRIKMGRLTTRMSAGGACNAANCADR